jgi:hypothetical protein
MKQLILQFPSRTLGSGTESLLGRRCTSLSFFSRRRPLDPSSSSSKEEVAEASPEVDGSGLGFRRVMRRPDEEVWWRREEFGEEVTLGLQLGFCLGCSCCWRRRLRFWISTRARPFFFLFFFLSITGGLLLFPIAVRQAKLSLSLSSPTLLSLERAIFSLQKNCFFFLFSKFGL